VYLTRRKSASGHLFALKMTYKFEENVELQVFQRAVGHPYLLQLVSFFETKVRSSYLNVSVCRQLPIPKFTVTINM